MLHAELTQGQSFQRLKAKQVWYNTFWHYAHKGNSSAEKGKGLM